MIDAQLINTAYGFFWPLLRISGLLLTMPVFNGHYMPTRIRLMLAVLLAMIVAPYTETQTLIQFDANTVVLAAKEICLGAMMGFVLQLVFQTFIIGGQIIAMQSGLGFATMVDPASSASVPLVSQFYLMLVSLLFLIFDGHLAMFSLLIKSFQVMPLMHATISLEQIRIILDFSAFLFVGAIAIAIPAIISLLVVNISFGIMTRAAPQLNIFAIGFPITLTLGVIIIYLTIRHTAPHIEASINHGLMLANQIAGG